MRGSIYAWIVQEKKEKDSKCDVKFHWEYYWHMCNQLIPFFRLMTMIHAHLCQELDWMRRDYTGLSHPSLIITDLRVIMCGIHVQCLLWLSEVMVRSSWGHRVWEGQEQVLTSWPGKLQNLWALFSYPCDSLTGYLCKKKSPITSCQLGFYMVCIHMYSKEQTVTCNFLIISFMQTDALGNPQQSFMLLNGLRTAVPSDPLKCTDHKH